jgi:hypothetical protein
VIEVSTHQTIEQVLQVGFYEIPRFQRPYSWSADNIGDFWTDTIQSETVDYFIGAFIVYESDDAQPGRQQNYAVVDGQQRITTITILLAAIRDAFARDGHGDLASGLQQYIARVDRRNQQRLILQTEGGFPYLQAHVQSFPPQETSGDPLRADERLIQGAYNYFTQELKSLRSSTFDDPTIPPADRPTRYITDLESIRDRILGLNVILVIVDNEDDAYTIFETLNTRGKDLNLVDLVRNFLLRDLRETEGPSDLPRARFNRMLAKLHDVEPPLDPSEFILHSWNSRYPYTSSKKIFRQMKEQVRTRDKKLDLLRSLETDVDLYIRVRRPQTGDWTMQMRDVRRSLRALRTFNMSQPVPVLLAALRSYDEDVLRMATLKRLFRAIEVFHFTFTAIAGKSSSGGISTRYALHARQFLGASREQATSNVTDLVQKLRAGAPTRDEFLAGFQSLGYTSTETRSKPLVQYVLEGLYRHQATGTEVEFEHMTIEHLAPENPRHDSDDLEEAPIAAIGNLIFVSETLNNQLANRPFREKQALLRNQSDLLVDPAVLSALSWGESEINERTTTMAELAFDRVWTMPS